MSTGKAFLLLILGMILVLLIFPVVFAASVGLGYVLAIIVIALGAYLIFKRIKVGDWEITVLDVKESTYVRENNNYYKAKEGYKAVIVTLRMKNLGEETASISDIRDFIIVSNANKSYGRVYTYELTYIYPVTEDVKSKAVPFKELDTTASLAPGTYIEGDLLFEMPENEEPVRLHLKIGIVGGYEVAIELKTS